LASRTAVETKNRKRKQQGKGQVNEVMPLVSRPAVVGKKKKKERNMGRMLRLIQNKNKKIDKVIYLQTFVRTVKGRGSLWTIFAVRGKV
jgi:hypothetical protein